MKRAIMWGVWDVKNQTWANYDFSSFRNGAYSTANFVRQISPGRYVVRQCLEPLPIEPKKRKPK